MRVMKLMKSTRGTALVLYVITFSVIAASVSVVVDIGMLVYQKANIVKATDAATLAAAQSLITGEENPVLVAQDYLRKNGVNPENAEIELLDGDIGISVRTTKEVDYVFARIIGFERGEIEAYAAAEIMAISSVFKGIKPFAIEEQELEFGKLYTLKEGGGSGSNGNYGCLALGGTGASNYKFNILNGYDGELKVGDYVSTEPGNMSNPTKSSIDQLVNSCTHHPECTYTSFYPDCKRIMTVVIVDDLDVNGRNKVQIRGFASFLVIAVKGQGNMCEVEGYFIRNIAQGELSEDQKDYGLRGIKLTK